MTNRRKVIVHIAASADGYIARPDGDLEWLTGHPKPKGFYGIGDFMKTIDTMVYGRKTYEVGLRLGATFVSEPVEPFMTRLRAKPGKNIWMMGGGDLIASFLDAGAIDEFVVSVV